MDNCQFLHQQSLTNVALGSGSGRKRNMESPSTLASQVMFDPFQSPQNQGRDDRRRDSQKKLPPPNNRPRTVTNQMVAAVVTPLTWFSRFITTPAPMNPMPDRIPSGKVHHDKGARKLAGKRQQQVYLQHRECGRETHQHRSADSRRTPMFIAIQPDDETGNEARARRRAICPQVRWSGTATTCR